MQTEHRMPPHRQCFNVTCHSITNMHRKNININGLNISILDNEKQGATLICLHGHFGTASNLSFMDNLFTGRVIIPDLRGHGLSDHARSYTLPEYLGDLEEIISILNIYNPTILGHSLGGIIAMSYEAKHQNCKMLIIEDIGTEVNDSNEFLIGFAKTFSSIYEVDKTFKDKLGRPVSNYFIESLNYECNSWKFRFDYEDMINSQKNINGTYWNEWKSIRCPVLIMRGEKSWATKRENIEEMIKQNNRAQLISYPNAGHGIHDDERQKFTDDFKTFIQLNGR